MFNLVLALLAGVVTVAALWGPFSHDVLAAAGPSFIIGDIRELEGIVQQWGSLARQRTCRPAAP